jgi:hypothetical protein
VTSKYLYFRYTDRRTGEAKSILLPLVHVHLKSESAEFDTVALVDSGATTSLLPREQAEILDLDYAKDKEGRNLKVETLGAGGTFNSEAAKIPRVEILKNVTPFARFTDMEILVPESEGVLPYMVLGRRHVFSRFDITFHENRRKMTFTKLRGRQ